MSEKLYESNNLIVTGYLTKNTRVFYGDTSESMADAISLQFTLLINGKMATFPLFFTLGEGFALGEDAITRWNTIEDILYKIGYVFKERNDKIIDTTDILGEWINKLRSNKII